MQVKALQYGQKDGESAVAVVPAPIQRMTEWMVQTAAVIMRSFGIAELNLDLVPSGHVPISVLKFKSADDTLMPKALHDIRIEILRGMLRTAFERFGLSTISVELTDAEREEVHQYWRYLETGHKDDNSIKDDEPLTTGLDDPLVFESIQLPFEVDPNDAPVVTPVAAPVSAPVAATVVVPDQTEQIQPDAQTFEDISNEL